MTKDKVVLHRIEEGRVLLKDHLKKISQMASVFLSSLKGFRRDLALSSESDTKFITTDFMEGIEELEVPVLREGRSFADLRQMLTFCTEVLYGTVVIKTPRRDSEQKEFSKILKEIEITHKNLLNVSDTAYRLYECIKTANFEIDVFNSKNIEAKMPEAYILFDRDAMFTSIETARALSECAVRIDIDLMETKKRLEDGDKRLKV